MLKNKKMSHLILTFKFLKKYGKNIKKHLIFRKTCHIILLASRGTDDAGHARLAQLAEHLTLNQGVQGSNP